MSADTETPEETRRRISEEMGEAREPILRALQRDETVQAKEAEMADFARGGARGADHQPRRPGKRDAGTGLQPWPAGSEADRHPARLPLR